MATTPITSSLSERIGQSWIMYRRVHLMDGRHPRHLTPDEVWRELEAAWVSAYTMGWQDRVDAQTPPLPPTQTARIAELEHALRIIRDRSTPMAGTDWGDTRTVELADHALAPRRPWTALPTMHCPKCNGTNCIIEQDMGNDHGDARRACMKCEHKWIAEGPDS